uniref:G-protein coupled receptors family 1 profile domain-containing protein n=1 Tax=Acrobeloides nanus TaxID=290746 RepID=A0A914D8K5_9BILA
MSFDRYVAVCHPMKLYFRSRKFIVSTITGLWLIAFILLLPMLSYAKANEILLHEVRTPGFMREGENITRVRVYKCSDSLPFSLFLWFTMSTFIMGYFVPLILIVFFNSRLIEKLYRHTRVLPRSGIPLRRITTYTILIAVMYFVCWTPYWCSVLYAIYMSLLSDGNSQSSETTLFIIYCFHLLPYIGSASNWILYGLLNTQLNLQKQHESNGQDDVLAAMNNGTAISSGFGLNEAPRKNDRSNSTFFGRVKPSNGNGLTVRDNDRLSLSLSLINFHEDSKDFK